MAKFGKFNLKLLDAIENTDEALEAELLKQDEIEIQVKSQMKSIQKWRRNHNSDVDETSSIDSNHSDNNVKFPRIHLSTFDGQYKKWKTSFRYVQMNSTQTSFNT